MKRLTNADQERIKSKVENALCSQFETYTWGEMLNDCLDTEQERRWALTHLSYAVVET